MALDIPEERGLSEVDVRWGDPLACHFPLLPFLNPPSLPWMCMLYLLMWIGKQMLPYKSIRTGKWYLSQFTHLKFWMHSTAQKSCSDKINRVQFLLIFFFSLVELVLCLSFVGAVGIMLGYHFKASCVLFAVPYWYILLLDTSTWNNHSYLYGLLAILLCRSSAHHCW